MDVDNAVASGSGSTSAAHQLLREALNPAKVSDAQVSQYYRERLQDRRIQITNLDRARPKTGGTDADARLRAENKLIRRRRRVKSELSELKRMRIAAGRSNRHTHAPDQTSEPSPSAEEPNTDDRAAKDIVRGKQRLLSDASKQLRRLRSISRGGKTPAKAVDKHARKALSRTQRKRLGLEAVDPHITYDLVRPLHDLWRTYIQQLLNIVALNSRGELVANPQFDARHLGTMSSGTVSAIQASLIKADLCGAEVEVVRAANPSLVAQRGLVVKETEHTLILAVPPQAEDKRGKEKSTRTIPKKNAVFAIDVPLSDAAGKLRFELHGNHMMHTLPSRATRKYKARPTIDF
jgi:ribonuclease P protein subunit POP4